MAAETPAEAAVVAVLATEEQEAAAAASEAVEVVRVAAELQTDRVGFVCVLSKSIDNFQCLQIDLSSTIQACQAAKM